MRVRFAIGAALILTCLGGAWPTQAQKATERYIPVGRSPGLSGKATTIGEIEEIEAGRRILRIAGPAGVQDVVIGERTTIWLDRTELGRSNTRGTLSDCRTGLTAEFKYEEPERGGAAEWIKLRLGELPPRP